jgi:uncharacterized integral membrane protein
MAILFLAVLILAVAVIFSAQNAIPVTLSFMKWQFSGSLAIVVFLAMLTGMLVMGLFWMGVGFKKKLKKKKPSSQDDVLSGGTEPPTRDRKIL